MAQRTAVVIGAGIGGLSAALALYRRGWRVTVLERAPRLEPVGAGIALAPNAVKALDLLGLGDWLGRAAVIQGSGGVRRPDGGWLVRTDLGQVQQRFGRPLLVVPRADLVAELVSRLPEGADVLRLGTVVTGIDAGDGGGGNGGGGGDDGGGGDGDGNGGGGAAGRRARVFTQDAEFGADLVVAADGIRSLVRGALFPEHPGPRYAGFTAWRMIAVVPDGATIEPSETWGRGAVFGIVPLAGQRVYCYATANQPAGTTFPDEKAALLSRFADWHEPIPALIRQTPADALLRNDIWELGEPLTRYDYGRVAVLGDAAHAMTPNLGQGGCQAIEDAVVLAHHVDDAVGGGLAGYTADRLGRTSRIVRQSARAGRMQQLDGPVRVALRDTMIRVAAKAGPGLILRQMAPLAGWTPPQD